MRALFLALLALALLPATATAQGRPPSLLQEIGAWTQRLTAAQQPVIDAYRECSPTLQQIQTILQTQTQDRAQLEPLQQALQVCFQHLEAAASLSRERLAAMPRMPAAIERELHIDSRDIMRRSAAATDGLVGYLEKSHEGLDAAIAGDRPLALRKMQEARILAGSVMDAQIVLLETIRASLPLQTHKSMMDVRLVVNRAMRAVAVTDFETDTGALTDQLHREGAAARSAAGLVRADWHREGASLRAAVARLRDPRQTAMMASLDTVFETIAAIGSEVASALEPLPRGRLARVDRLRIARELADAEIRLVEAIRAMGVAAARVN